MVQKRYVRADEERAAFEQVQGLGRAGEAILPMRKEEEEGPTQAGVLAKDADSRRGACPDTAARFSGSVTG